MRLLQEIIGLLSDKDGSLTDALLKTKVLITASSDDDRQRSAEHSQMALARWLS